MLYYMYEIRNNLNNKIYVGVHKTNKIDDGYMGSGKVINRAIEKYGIENFTKVILEYFDDSESMYAREKEIVTEEFLDRDDTYNLRRGGFGGFDFINVTRSYESRQISGKIGSDKGGKRFSGDYNPRTGKIYITNGINDKLIIPGSLIPLGYYFGRTCGTATGIKSMNTVEANNRRRESFARNDHSKGEKNSQFGSKWITNEIESKKVSNIEFIPDGWRNGRVINKRQNIS